MLGDVVLALFAILGTGNNLPLINNNRPERDVMILLGESRHFERRSHKCFILYFHIPIMDI